MKYSYFWDEAIFFGNIKTPQGLHIDFVKNAEHPGLINRMLLWTFSCLLNSVHPL